MKKNTCYLIFFIMIFSQNLNAARNEDTSNDKRVKIKPYINITNGSEFNVLNDLYEIPQFIAFKNKTNVEMGLYFHFNKWVMLNFFAGTEDLKWKIKKSGSFEFENAALFLGGLLSIRPVKFFQLSSWISNMEQFEPGSSLWTGFSAGLDMELEIEKVHLNFKAMDELHCLFQKDNDKITGDRTKLLLENSFKYQSSFNFFNFIHPSLNTGIFVEGKLETHHSFYDLVHDDTSLENELYAGFQTNPIPYFKACIAYAMFYELKYNNDMQPKIGSKELDLGLKAGITFICEWFSMEINYIPHLYTSIDDVPGKINHFFEFNLEFDLKKK